MMTSAGASLGSTMTSSVGSSSRCRCAVALSPVEAEEEEEAEEVEMRLRCSFLGLAPLENVQAVRRALKPPLVEVGATAAAWAWKHDALIVSLCTLSVCACARRAQAAPAVRLDLFGK